MEGHWIDRINATMTKNQMGNLLVISIGIILARGKFSDPIWALFLSLSFPSIAPNLAACGTHDRVSTLNSPTERETETE